MPATSHGPAIPSGDTAISPPRTAPTGCVPHETIRPALLTRPRSPPGTVRCRNDVEATFHSDAPAELTVDSAAMVGRSVARKATPSIAAGVAKIVVVTIVRPPNRPMTRPLTRLPTTPPTAIALSSTP
jgi:hypothetical protein